MGDPLLTCTLRSGLINSESAVEPRTSAFVETAQAEGGDVVTGGGTRFLTETRAATTWPRLIVTGVTPDATLSTTRSVRSGVWRSRLNLKPTAEAESSWPTATVYGLAGAVWTSNLSRGRITDGAGRCALA